MLHIFLMPSLKLRVVPDIPVEQSCKYFGFNVSGLMQVFLALDAVAS